MPNPTKEGALTELPKLELEISREELADLRGRSDAAALELRDYMRELLSLPDEESSRAQRCKNAADDFRAQLGRWR